MATSQQQKAAFTLQSQIKQNAVEAQDYLASLNEWEKTIRAKDEALRNSPAGIAAAEKAAATQKQFDDAKEKGNALYGAGDLNGAVASYTQCIALLPTNALGYLNRAQAYLRLKRYSDADADATDALRFDAKNLKALYRRASARMELGSTDAALADINEMFAAERNNKQAKELAAKLHALLSAPKPKTAAPQPTTQSPPQPRAKPPATASSAAKSKSAPSHAATPMATAQKSNGDEKRRAPPAATKTKVAIVEVADDDDDAGDSKAPIATAKPAAASAVSADTKQPAAAVAAPTAAPAAAPALPSSSSAAVNDQKRAAPATAAPTAPAASTSSSSSSVAVHPVPKSSYEFERLYNALRGDARAWITTVRHIPAAQWAETLQSGLDGDMLAALLDAAHAWLLPAADYSGVCNVLDGLSRCERFEINALFLTATDKHKLNALFAALQQHPSASPLSAAQLSALKAKFAADS